ncbi:MAG: S8 family serine peptidase [Coriobacteriales bacterium]
MPQPGFHTSVSIAACTALVLACLPTAALAGENVTVAQMARTDTAIQDAIDELQELEEGTDYAEDQILVTYSGKDQAELVQLDEGESVQDALEDAIDDSMVTAAQPNYRYRLLDTVTSSSTLGTAAASSASASASSDPLSSSQYYLDAWDPSFTSSCGANVSAAWELVQTQRSVTVAVIDTGVQLSHTDLNANIDTEHMATVTRYQELQVGTMDDQDGHGTHVAGIIAASAGNGVGVAGVSANAQLLPINVFYQLRGESMCDTASVVRAFQYLDELVESGQLTNLHVVNLSLGSYSAGAEDKLLQEEIAHMRSEHQVLTVCAGGNGDDRGNALTEASYPADFSECVSVTALNEDGTNASWSDYNAYKDISAPGVNILSTFSDEYASYCLASSSTKKYVKQSAANNSYGYLEGTSMSSPIVAGIAALLWAAYPQLTVGDAVTALTSTAHSVNPALNDHSKPVTVTVPSFGRRWGINTVTLPASGSAGAVDAAAAVSWVLEKAQAGSLDAAELTAVSAPDRAALASLSAKKKGFTAKWTQLSAVAGYQLRYRLASSSSWKTSAAIKATKSSKSITGLKQGKKYYVQLRAYRLDASGAKLYGPWSAKKAVTAK